MTKKNKSRERAEEIIKYHISKIINSAFDYIMSIVLVGSLSNGSYTGNAGSDIDLIHVLKDDVSLDTKSLVMRLIEATETETNNDIPLSKCVYYLRELNTPYDKLPNKATKDLIELPVEILRMKETGITLFGKDIINTINEPSKEDILDSFRISRQSTAQLEYDDPVFYENYQKTIQNPTMRILAQIILTSMMKDLYIATGIFCSNKFDILSMIKQHVQSHRFIDLLELCVKWRYDTDNFNEDDEVKAKILYQEWRLMREGKDIDFIPLST